MKHFFTRYGGILAGALYGLVARLVLDFTDEFRLGSLFSITFMWIVPVVVGLLPLLLAGEAPRRSLVYQACIPVASISLFFVTALAFRIEDLVCVLIIALPFVAGALLAWALGVFIYRRVRDYKQRRRGLYSLMLFPLLLAAVEDRIPSPSGEFTVRTSVVVQASSAVVWENIVRVKPIGREEYTSGLFNYAGIPRPLYAELDRDTLGGTRIGYFEGGLKFVETVAVWERERELALDITVDPASVRQTVFDQHVLKGRSFEFVRANYSIHQLDRNRVELVLSSSYRLHTKVNAYGAWWGQMLLSDFQERLLEVIKERCIKVATELHSTQR